MHKPLFAWLRDFYAKYRTRSAILRIHLKVLWELQRITENSPGGNALWCVRRVAVISLKIHFRKIKQRAMFEQFSTKQVAISFWFADWLRESREFSGPIIERRKKTIPIPDYIWHSIEKYES